MRIEDSGGGTTRTAIGPDTAVCEDCLREMLDPADRRYRYAFINCTQCGPRYTITQILPYDRANTSMAPFFQCASCRSEYDDPLSRRFHAQPNACPDCGPRLRLTDAAATVLERGDPIAAAVDRLMRGEILAVKGLGGYHLACDARNPQAVARLRQRKNREEKPLAVMVAGAASASSLAQLNAPEVDLLESRERPIVLLPKAHACDGLLRGVAPGIAWLGVMLPYTPLHYLLFHEAAGRPAGIAWLTEPQPLALVMTSANPGGEPLVVDDDEAERRLHGIADAFLMHDRAILVRCDDSVVRHEGRAAFVRRARGYTPRAIKLPVDGPSVVATGAWLKNTVCVTRGDEAFLSQHIGDLDNAATCVATEQTLAARFAQPAAASVAQMLARSLNAAHTSSAGRWFDAAAGLLAVKSVVTFEGQAAMLLEGLAARHGPVSPLNDGYAIGADGTLDLLPLLAALAEPVEPAYGTALFHATLSQALGDWVVVHARRSGADTVALGGGCFVNSILSTALRLRLSAGGLRVLEACRAPPNDGGLALGQALVGALHLLTAREAASSTAC